LSKITAAEKKRLRALLTKKGRQEAGQFLAEGIRLLEESLHHRYYPIEVFYVPAQLDSRSVALIENYRRAGIAGREITSLEMKQISDTAANQGVLVLFNISRRDIKKMDNPKFRRILILDNISDPGNAGTILRSALAFGFNPVIFSENSVEPLNPKVVRSSAGAIFGIDLHSLSSAEIKEFIKKGNFKVIAADIKGDRLENIGRIVAPSDKIILAVGSEAEGLSPFINELCDLRIRISHTDKVESLNAAVAASILMKEIYYIDTGTKK
jgi:TrmH family RNA methyltransferase